MQIVEALGDALVSDTAGRGVYNLRGGLTYLLHDHEAQNGVRDGALAIVDTSDRLPGPYKGQALDKQRLLLAFIGKLGDAVVTASCIQAMVQKHPNVVVDIACMPGARAVFELAPRFGEIIDYPARGDSLHCYDFYLSFESIGTVPNAPRRSCGDVFSTCLPTPRPTGGMILSVATDVRSRWQLAPSLRPRVAVQVGPGGGLRSYPADLTDELIERLSRDEYEIYLLGADDSIDVAIGAAKVCELDLRGKTPTPADLASVLAQMQAFVTGDSFPLHLAGTLGIPTIAIFTSTDAAIGSDYSSVRSVQSDAECSPCLCPLGACPLGHGECIAHRETAVSPTRITALIRAALGVARTA